MDNSQFLSKCTADALDKAASQLVAGHLVAFPTETVYGLGADASNPAAVRRIYEVKGRPMDHPLIVHISSMQLLEVWASDIPEYAIKIARDFWPGPMTLVLKRTSKAKDFITGGQDSVAIRIPNNSIALTLLASFESKGGKGVAAPSANRFGQVSSTSSEDVKSELGQFLNQGDLILEGGKCDVGIESTIIDCSSQAPRILRPGAITSEMLETSAGVLVSQNSLSQIRISGSLEKHYAPRAKVILNETPRYGQAFMALSNVHTPRGVHRISSPADIAEFARNLYAVMRKADDLGYSEIVVQLPQGHGIELALLDRLSKAAQGR